MMPSRTPLKPGQARRASRPTLVLLAAWTALAGCASPPHAASGVMESWKVRQGQAVWKPSRTAQEVAGDITVATGAPGEYLVEFAKPAMTLVRVVRRPGGWEITAPGRGSYHGRGTPPKRSWFQLGELLSNAPLAAPWRGEVRDSGSAWSLENPRTGERIEGYLAP